MSTRSTIFIWGWIHVYVELLDYWVYLDFGPDFRNDLVVRLVPYKWLCWDKRHKKEKFPEPVDEEEGIR